MSHPRPLTAVLVVLAASTALLLPSVTSAATSGRLLPNLRMLRLSDWHLVTTDTGQGQPRRRLRFTSILVNVGRGPLDLEGERACSSISACPRMTVTQRIRHGDGTWERVPSLSRMRYEVGDHHHHWHVIGIERFELFSLSQPGGGAPIRGQKFGFCFFDERAYRLGLDGAPRARVYPEYGVPPRPGCGDAYSLRTHVGLSVGWADTYPWFFAGQFIEVTGVPDGRYLVCATADADGRVLEGREHDNQSWARIRVRDDDLTLLRDGRSPCAAHLPPP